MVGGGKGRLKFESVKVIEPQLAAAAAAAAAAEAEATPLDGSLARLCSFHCSGAWLCSPCVWLNFRGVFNILSQWRGGRLCIFAQL